MYTDEDLEQAVKKGIFSADAVATFRQDKLKTSHTHYADEENIKLVASFNDIFVVIAIGLLLGSLGWVAHSVSAVFSVVLIAATSWGLAEFFVLKRQMALPAIILLITFASMVFHAAFWFISAALPKSDYIFVLSALITTIGIWLHWLRFKVPITVAAGVIAGVALVIALLLAIIPNGADYLSYMLFIAGLAVFYLAMRWDLADLARISSRSDVAFWLHLTAAPLLVHPVFSNLAVEGSDVVRLTGAVLLYIVLIMVSLVINRRAFMVSSLIYVLVALTKLFDEFEFARDNNLAFVGIIIGFSLLLLSGFWHSARKALVMRLPAFIQQNIPELK